MSSRIISASRYFGKSGVVFRDFPAYFERFNGVVVLEESRKLLFSAVGWIFASIHDG